MPVPFVPGQLQAQSSLPLERFLPPYFPGMAASWVGQFAEPSSWILDPFGSDPLTDLELAQAGYRVLVTANNPVFAFILEVLASAPSIEEIGNTLQKLANLRMSDGQRFEDYIKSFYHLSCPSCQEMAEVETFIWNEDQDAPTSLQIECEQCGFSGEVAATPDMLQSLRHLPSYALHRSRALELAADPEDPMRPVMEDVVRFYSPRALILLQILLNKINDPVFTERQKTLLQALFLTTADQMNQLWAYPLGRNRPHQLLRPPTYQEMNLWRALLRSSTFWQTQAAEVMLKPWPSSLPQKGGISLFRGRLREVGSLSDSAIFSLVFSSLPRRNQAFWNLSGLWTGWLWGKEAITPLRHSLLRQHYDWTWHSHALSKVLVQLPKFIQPEKPVLLQIGELDPLFMLAALLGAQEAGLGLKTYAIDGEESTLQTVWRQNSTQSKPTAAISLLPCAREAVWQHLSRRGEPATHLTLLTQITIAAHHQGLLVGQPHAQPNHSLNEVQAELESVLQDASFLKRYNPGATLESGLYWLTDPPKESQLLAEQLEAALLDLLAQSSAPTQEEVLQQAYTNCPGLLTPPSELIEAIMSTYADKLEGEHPSWQRRPKEEASSRQHDLEQMQHLLQKIAERLGYSMQCQAKIITWHDENQHLVYSFFPSLTTIISPFIASYQELPGQKYVLIPGSRSNLISFKLRRDPHLQELCAENWHFIKFRQVRVLATEPLLTREVFPIKILEDPPEYQRSQLPLF